MKSPLIKPSKTHLCFSFYSYIFGQIDKIELTTISNDGVRVNYTWYKTNSYQDIWDRKFITIHPQNDPFIVSKSIFILLII